MNIDLKSAATFMATRARLLDRRRFEVLFRDGDPAAALAALEGYRNPDGGYGHGLEPDCRSATSQPGGALHAFEVFADIGPVSSPRAAELCDWLASISLPDGGIPFALPMPDPFGSAPFWANADPSVSSLQITAIVALVARRVAAHDPAVAAHPWLANATRYCLDEIEKLDGAPHALVLAFAMKLVDALGDARLTGKLGRFVPDDGVVAVGGGIEGEAMRPLDFAPDPDGPARKLFRPEVIEADLLRVAGGQHEDGGWRVDYTSYSPAAALEWNGLFTVNTLSLLRANGLA
ncbi:prenyltransferase/squalene oxidase repeat-containing protein [Amycolatopsis thailandensis]|uniref:Prenyltransferase n=1 Tax=Amycolatopsis thailandensis TaxID=589330 RepID=A0A229SGR8_9PSEU|nr:hypothetical protein [Amycolatopsis thailandensis]OXM57939.1 hypothetical protein CFP71_05370 [Amycolatopsis thailandensis]